MTKKTIEAKLPKKTITWMGIGGKIQRREIAARVAVYTCDEQGRWTGEWGPVLEADVIDVCRAAANWPAIRAVHFPMFGFHA